MHEHPVVSHFQKSGRQSEILRISDVLSARQLRNKALYTEHYLPLGRMLDCLPILWQEKDTVNAIGVHRHKQFSGDEQTIMEFLRPHLIRAHANSLVVSKLAHGTELLECVLQSHALGVVVLKSDRSIDFITTWARRLIETYFGAPTSSDRLPEILDLWIRQHDAGARAILQSPPPSDRLVIHRDDCRLIVRLLPASGETLMTFEEQELSSKPRRSVRWL